MKGQALNVQSSTLNAQRSMQEAVALTAYDLGFVTAQSMHAAMELNRGNYGDAQLIIQEMIGTVARCQQSAKDLKEVAK